MDETIFKSENTKSNLFTSVKSYYILQEIFSFLKIENFLNLIIYNKQLQKKFGYNLEYYKKISGKYRLYNKCGRGEVYKLNTKIKLFEGEYLNGERNGNGKEFYDDGKLKFEGEYLNGKRKGKGKEYYDKLEFEKEYLNSKRNRKRREYIKNKSDFNDSIFFKTIIVRRDYSSEEENKFILSEIMNNLDYITKIPSEKENEYYDNSMLGERNEKCKENYDNAKLKFEGE